MKRFFVHMALLLTAFMAVAQKTDSLQVLPEVKVRDMRKAPMDNGKTLQKIPTQILQPDIGSLLQAASPVVIKSYGPGMLASLSIRGTGAAHSPVLWNGLSIQSSMSGQQDMSLLQGFLFDHILLSTGSQNNLSTGGILGGSIQLGQEKIKTPVKVIAGIDLGSFHTQRYKLGMDLSKKGWSNRFRVVSQTAKNDFTYPDRSAQGSPLRKMDHAQSSLLAVLNETHYEYKRWKTGLDFWYQKANRQIPPTLLSPSLATQDDESIRLNAFVNYADSLRFVQFNSAMFAENLWYHDPAKNLDGLNHSTRWLNQIQLRRKYQHFSLQAGALHQLDQAGSSSYLKEEVQLHTAAAYLAAYGQLLKNRRLFWKTDIRQEFRKTLIPAPSFSAGMDYLLNRRIILSGHLAHISRLPNLNDLYWNPGGDPELSPEKGFSGELTYAYTYSKVNTLAKVRLTAYYSVIDQWIIWLPDNGYWTPQNLQQVHNRGFEWEAKLIHHHKKNTMNLSYGGSFTLASNEKAKNEQDLSVGKQLIYVPFWKNYIALALPYKNFLLSYRHSFTGGRYTSSDNLSFLPPYSTGDLELGYSHELKQHRLNTSLGIQNIWNVYYESIEWRPMPGRYFQVSLNYQFIHKK
ncbi:MAG TPA: hypothetical protein DIW47_12920 [Bacteroidetes bacterium]|nr:hypothetical protein [Bacteroidota bacterium]